ncbi:MAG: phage scaffolding protein [Methanobrevibacter sp.]|nr:phage scaffolding protein [Methanobrevibacter sp.]
MKRENLDFLEEEQIDKVMALYGKAMTKKDKEIETLTEGKKELEDKVATYETKINEFNESAKDNADWKEKYEELQTSIKEQEAKKKAEEEDKILTENINGLFEGKTFTSEYARIGLLNDIKAGLNKPENKGKGIQYLFDELTKDKTDIFANPNQIKDMDGMGDSEQDNNTKEIPTLW